MTRQAVTITSHVTAAASRPASQIPAPTLTLSWQYLPAPEIVFNIWHRTNLSAGKWERVATVAEKTFRFTPDLPAEFFTVTASNTLNGLESDLP